MKANLVKFIQGIFLISGTIIGVGMFGIPFVIARSGLLLGLFELALLTAVMAVVHLMYGEIILRTPTVHRLPGYVELYLGRHAKIFSLFSYFLGLSGALLAYTVIGGKLTGDLFHLSPVMGPFFFWAAGSAFILFNIRQSGVVDTLLNAALIGFMFFFIFGSLPFVQPDNFSFGESSAGSLFENALLPYGVILFAIAGLVVVPEVRALFGIEKTGLLKRTLIWGTVLPGVLYGFFALVVIGISGEKTTPDALIGLKDVLPASFVALGEIIAILAAFTSYIIIGLTLKETYFFDMKISHKIAWLLTCFIPFALFLLGMQNFILIIGFLGAIGVGIDALLTIAVFARAQKAGARSSEYYLALPSSVLWGIAGMFLLGMVYEIAMFF